MLKIENIRKVFNPGTINEKVALDGVDLTLEEGEFVTVIGGNGAGKSTTLNAVAGVWPVDSGKIYIGGEDVTKLSEHRRAQYLGRVFQDPMTGTATTMSIEENMAIAARRGKSRTAAKVLEISDQIISENHLTAMMVTHNMKDAIAHGNRLIMMHEGKVILNIAGEDKKKLTVGDLLHQFEKVSGEEFASDKALLS